MCYLLEDITYGELYSGKFGPVLSKIKTQANFLSNPANSSLNVGAYRSGFKIKTLLYDALDDVSKIAGINDVILKKLFSQKYNDPNSPEKKMADRFHKMYTDSFEGSDCQLEHFCCPFLYYQEQGVNNLDPSVMNNFLASVGHKRMVELFREKKSTYTEEQTTILRDARKMHHILVDNSPRRPPGGVASAEIGVCVFPPSNGMKCDVDAGRCVDSTDPLDWCNDAGGSCSGASV